jgi:SAM-dependent methyltransferase
MLEEYGTPEERYRELSAIYDDLFPYDADAEATVEFLAGLAQGGRMLELGVGTGRIAIPLAGRGCRVTGVETSSDMLRILKSKDASGEVRAVQCDMGEPAVEGPFEVVYAVYNTLFALLTQELQVRCVRSAADLLAGGGRLVVEGAIPAIARKPDRVSVTADFNDLRRVMVQIARHDHLRQLVEFRHVHLGEGEVKVLPAVHRYVHVPELDLMAELAGLGLEARYGDWRGAPFGAASSRHISVYRAAKGRR